MWSERAALAAALGALLTAGSASAQTPETAVVRASSLYDTEPVGVEDQPHFLNAVAQLETQLALAISGLARSSRASAPRSLRNCGRSRKQ